MKTQVKRSRSHFVKIRRGFTLMEVVIAIGILGIALPLGLASMATTSESNGASDAETRAALATRSIRSQLPELFGGKSASGAKSGVAKSALPSTDQTLYLELDKYGEIRSSTSESEFQTGKRGGETRFLAKVIYEKLVDARVEGLEMAQLTIRIDYPAEKREALRRQFAFTERRSYE